MKTQFLFAISLLLSSRAALADAAVLVHFADLATLAKTSVTEEVQSLSEGDYPSKWIRHLHSMGKTQIDPEYLASKCIYDEKDLLAPLSPTLSGADDAFMLKKSALIGLKQIYDARLWKLASRICVRARARFVEKLSALGLDEESTDAIPRILFFPTDYGRPSFRRSALSAVGYALNGALLFGGLGNFIGLPISKVSSVFLTSALIANSGLGIYSSIPKANAHLETINGILSQVTVQ